MKKFSKPTKLKSRIGTTREVQSGEQIKAKVFKRLREIFSAGRTLTLKKIRQRVLEMFKGTGDGTILSILKRLLDTGFLLKERRKSLYTAIGEFPSTWAGMPIPAPAR